MQKVRVRGRSNIRAALRQKGSRVKRGRGNRGENFSPSLLLMDCGTFVVDDEAGMLELLKDNFEQCSSLTVVAS